MKKIKLFLCVVLVAMFASLFSGCATVMPIPEIKEGRFDFSVTYEINGEEKTYFGVYVCKYAGIYVRVYGNGRMWDDYIEGTDSDNFVAVETTDDITLYIDFGFYPEYFMADPDYFVGVPQPALWIEYYDDEIGGTNLLGEQKEIFENYGIKIISYQYPEPIANSFKDSWSIGQIDPGIN